MAIGPEGARRNLDWAISNILDIDRRGGNDNERMLAEEAAFEAVHEFCSAMGVDYGPDGKVMRLNFAVAIDRLIKQGKNLRDYSYDIGPQQIIENLDSNSEVMKEPLPQDGLRRFWGAFTNAWSEPKENDRSSTIAVNQRDAAGSKPHMPTRVLDGGTSSSVQAELPAGKGVDSLTRKERFYHRFNNRVLKTLGAVAIVAGVAIGSMFAAKGGDNFDERIQSLAGSVPTLVAPEHKPLTDTSATSQGLVTTTTIMSSTETDSTHASEDQLSLESTGESAGSTQGQEATYDQSPDRNATDVVITFNRGDNLWNHLQMIAVGHSGPEADLNGELNQAISMALFFIAEANNSTIDDLNNIDVGQSLIIPQGVVSHLKSFNR